VRDGTIGLNNIVRGLTRAYVVIVVNDARTQNGHIRNDTRDVSQRIQSTWDTSICHSLLLAHILQTTASPSKPRRAGVLGNRLARQVKRVQIVFVEKTQQLAPAVL